MENYLEKEAIEQRSESPVSSFLLTYLRINRDSFLRLRNELRERTLSASAIDKVLGTPEIMEDLKIERRKSGD